MKANEIEMAVLPEFKVVTDAPVARRLLKDGYKVVDIKPKRGSERESIFVFQVEPGLIEKMHEYVAERREKFPKKYEKSE